MRRLALVIGALVLVTAALVVWLNGAPEAGQGAPLSSQPPGEVPFVHGAGDPSAQLDAGVGAISGTMTNEAGAPVAGARVRLFTQGPQIEALECGVCHQKVLDCDDPATVRQVIDGLRKGRFVAPVPVAETVTDAAGAFAFADAPLGGDVVVTAGELSAVGLARVEPLELVLSEPVEGEVTPVDEKEQLLRDARVSLYSPLEGTLVEVPLDAEGVARARSADPLAWFFCEREGLIPASRRLTESHEGLVLSAPRTLAVKTLSGGQPVEVEVVLPLHGADRAFKTEGGQLRLEGLRHGHLEVSVRSEQYAAPPELVELAAPVTEVSFELRRGAKLLVRATTAAGEPLASLSGTLTGQGIPLNAEAEDGALLVFEAVPEGEYSLSLEAPGFVVVERAVDLQPGETTLELTLRPVLKLTGKVLGPDKEPVEGARVAALEDGEEVAIGLTEEDGSFELELSFPGPIELSASELRKGVASQKLTVPSGPVTLVLAARGVLEVEVEDFDGTPLSSEAMVRSERDGSMNWVEDSEPVGRLAGLPGGWYLLERTVPERVPLSQRVEVVEGRVTRVKLKASEGARLSGRVVDHQGRPVEGATVLLTEQAQSVKADQAGRFTLKGVPAGPAELVASDLEGAESAPLQVNAPASELLLTIPLPARVRGRVVDASGAPVRVFLANDQEFTAADGRFEVAAPQKTLDVSADGYTSAWLAEASGDVGDVVLTREPLVEGEVVDAEGRPVSGATVMASNDLTPVATDAQGRFKLRITSEGAQQLLATRGVLAGETPLKVGALHHLVLQRGGLVVGRVVNAAGQPVPTAVTITGRFTSRPIELETDEQGRFQVELGPAVWLFATRFNRVQRAVEVRSGRVELTLGEESGACGLALRSPSRFDGLWLVSGPVAEGDAPWDLLGRAAGSLEVPISQPSSEVNARGLPCGRYTLFASLDGQLVSQPLELRSAAQALELSLPRSEEPVP